MAVVYIDSAYAGSEGAVSGDLGFGTGTIYSHPSYAWPALVSGDDVYLRSDRLWTPISGAFFTATGINGKSLNISRYGGDTSAELPFLDGSYYVDTSSGWSYLGGGVWQKTIVTGGTWSRSDCMFIDTVRPGTSYSSWVQGTMMRKANGNYASGYVNGNNPLNGNGIWWDFLSGTNLVLQVWTGSASLNPIAAYGCLRGLWGKSGAGAAQYALNVCNAGADDTEIHEIAAFGCRNSAAGCATGTTTTNNILFDSIRMLCSPYLMNLNSSTSGAYVQNVELSGDWYADDMIDPVTAPCASLADGVDFNSWEGLSFNDRCRDILVSNGKMRNGGGHGAVSIKAANAGDGSQARGQRCTVDGTWFAGDIRARNNRGMAIGNFDDTRITRAKFTGYTTRSQIAGTRTVINQTEWSALGGDLLQETDANPAVQILPSIDAGTVSVSIFNSYIDNTGRVARGATEANACVGMSASNGSPLTAGSCNISCNVLLADNGNAAFWISNGPTAGANNEVNSNQTVMSNWWNSGAGAKECYIKNGTGTGTAGTTVTTVAARLNTGNTTGTVQKTIPEIQSGGGGRPMTRVGSMSVDRVPF